MINLKSLIDFLPPIFKNTDTYKVGGKGILERFLEVCGEYLEDEITPDIENTLDIIDIKNVDPIYLNYLWELLGEIPFGSNMAIDKDQWDRYYDGTLSKEELTKLSKNWVIPKEGIISLDDTRIRDLLKYSLTLLKVRGTKKFFETLFKIYGIECTITEVDDYDKGLYAKLTRTDNSNNIDDITTDTHQQCDECLTINVDVFTHYYYSDKYGVLIMGSDEVYFVGKNDYISMDTKEGVELYNTYTLDNIPDNKVNEWKSFIEFRRVIEQLFDKYLPCNVTPNITYNGILPNDRTQVNVQYLTDQHITNENPVVKIKVLVTSTYSRSGNKFYMSKDSINWSSKTFDSGHIFNIEDEGDLYFKSVDTPSSLDYITVVKHITPEPLYRLVVDGMGDNERYNSISTPVFWAFKDENGTSQDYVEVILALLKGNQRVPIREVFISVNGGPAEGIVHEQGGIKSIELPIGDNRISWVDNPDVYIDIKVLSSEETLNPPKPKFRGLPYGVSGSFSQLEYYKENGVVKQKHTQLGVFGTYGAVGTPENPLGNVVTLGCTPDIAGAYNMEALVTNLKPWAYRYNKINGTVEPIEGLTKVDILYCNDTVNRAYLDDYINDDARSQVKNNLQATDVFYKASTITVTPSDVINLTEYMPDPGYFIRGGIILLHPNTEELMSKGLNPNSGTDSEFRSNFLVVVIPSIDSEDKSGITSTSVGFKYTEFSSKYQEYRDPSGINESGRIKVSEYRRGDIVREGITPLKYGYLYIEETAYTSDGITNQLGLDMKGEENIFPPLDETTYLGLTKVLVLNNKGYSSLKNKYIADPIPSRESITSYPVFFYNDIMDLSGFYWDYLERVNLIFIDCWAPFMNTQLMVRKYEPSNIKDGLYLKPILDIPEDDIKDLSDADFQNKYPGFPWDRSQIQGYLLPTSTIKGLLVLETDSTKDTFRKIHVNTVHNVTSAKLLQDTLITPVKFQFVVYKNGEEWDKDYYLVDSSGVKYLPNRTYEIRDLGITNFKAVPNLTSVSTPPAYQPSYTPSFHEVYVYNGMINGSPSVVKQELKLTRPKCIINSTKSGRKILVGIRQVYPVLNSYTGVDIYQVTTEGSTNIILSEDLVEQLPLEISSPGTYSFVLKDSNTGMIISDIVRLEITDPYNNIA